MPREKLAQIWWYMSFIPILRSREGQVDLYEFKTKLVYIVSSRPARLHSNTLTQNNKKIGLLDCSSVGRTCMKSRVLPWHFCEPDMVAKACLFQHSGGSGRSIRSSRSA